MSAMTEQDAEGMLKEIARVTSRYPRSVRKFVRDLVVRDQFMRAQRYREGYRYQTFEDLLLDLGTPRKATLELPTGIEQMEVGQCFENAHNMALRNPHLTYMEGMAMYQLMPVQHAWLEGPDGRIIDPTWAALPQYVGNREPHAFYLGVAFDTTFIARNSLQTGFYSVFGHDLGEYVRLGLVLDNEGLAFELGEQ